jgi:hypothetical protein
MRSVTRKDRLIRLTLSVFLVVAAFAVLALSPAYLAVNVSAHSGGAFGPACGVATMDGVLNAT